MGSRELFGALLCLAGCAESPTNCADCGTDSVSGGGSAGEAGIEPVGGAAAPASGGAAGEPAQAGSSHGGMAQAGNGGAAGAAPDCSANAECDDHSPCTEDLCDAGACRHEPRPDNEVCDDGSPCTVDDQCLGGDCVGQLIEQSPELTSSVFGYGSEYREGSELSGGLSAFLGDERVVFADRLDGSGSVLSVVKQGAGGVLEVEAQAITGAPLRRLPFGSWSWQNRWVSHLQALSDSAFVLAEIDAGVELFMFAGGVIRKTDHFRFQDVVGPIEAVASSGNGRLWACVDGISQFGVGLDEKLQPLTGVLFEGERPTCSSIAVSPDGKTVFASAAPGILRWSAEDAAPHASLALPGINGLIRGVSEELVLLQARGKLDAFGELRLYRLSDGSLVRTEAPSSTESPFAGAVVQGRWVTAWDIASEGGALHRQSLVWGTEVEPTSAWKFREWRADGLDWAPNYENLSTRGAQLLLQPWRRWLSLETTDSVRELTGPGHGSIVELAGQGPNAALALGPYGYTRVALSASQALSFDAGGIRAEAAFEPALRVVLADSDHPLFTPRPALVEQAAELASLSLVAATPSGPRPRALVEVGHGPALLAPRGAQLFQLSFQRDAAGFALRRFALDQASGSARLIANSTAMLVPGSTARGAPESFTFDVNDAGTDVLVLESWPSEGAFERRVSWFRVEEEGVRQLGSDELPASTGSPVLTLGRDVALVFDGDTTYRFRVSGPGLERTVTRHSEQAVSRVLGVDRGERFYVARARGAREELAVFDDEARLRGALTLPGRALSLAVAGQSLLVSTNSSVHRLSPSCGEVLPIEPEPWPIMDADDWQPPAPSGCRSLTPCQTWEPPAQAGDVDRSGCVDAADVAIVTRCYAAVADSCRESVLADLNGNGVVDDYPIVAANYGKGCAP